MTGAVSLVSRWGKSPKSAGGLVLKILISTSAAHRVHILLYLKNKEKTLLWRRANGGINFQRGVPHIRIKGVFREGYRRYSRAKPAPWADEDVFDYVSKWTLFDYFKSLVWCIIRCFFVFFLERESAWQVSSFHLTNRKQARSKKSAIGSVLRIRALKYEQIWKEVWRVSGDALRTRQNEAQHWYL